MNVYCFDTDGTLESSGGPVTISHLRGLRNRRHAVCIVSPSSAYPVDKKGRPAFDMLNVGDRTENLRELRRRYPKAKRYVYVSDNGDLEVAELAGFEYVWAHEFKD